VVVERVNLDDSWTDEMDSWIGNTYKVTQTEVDGGENYIYLDDEWWFHESALAPAQYEHAAGDVVEFEYKDKALKGIVYRHLSAGLMVENGSIDCFYVDDPDLRNCTITRKVGFVDTMKDVSSAIAAMTIAKAYFSKPTFTGTYPERQAQAVKHYGWKVGSKVEVVRKFKDCEDGYGSMAWDGNSVKKSMQGGVYEIRHIRKTHIGLFTEGKDDWWGFPCFALEPVTE